MCTFPITFFCNFPARAMFSHSFPYVRAFFCDSCSLLCTRSDQVEKPTSQQLTARNREEAAAKALGKNGGHYRAPVASVNGGAPPMARKVQGKGKCQRVDAKGQPLKDKSEYRGVSWHRQALKWKAKITVAGKTVCVCGVPMTVDSCMQFRRSSRTHPNAPPPFTPPPLHTHTPSAHPSALHTP